MDDLKNEELNNFSLLLRKNKGEVKKRRRKHKKRKAFNQMDSLVFFPINLNPIKFVFLLFSLSINYFNR
jgi:hypothetical protein